MKRLIEYLLDKLQHSPLMEMAFFRASISEKVGHLQIQIARHICKLLTMPNDISYNHWQQEVNAWIHDIQDMTITKTNQKRLDGNRYYFILFTEPFGEGVWEFEMRLKTLKTEGYNIPKFTEQEIRLLYQKLEQIYHDVCYDISLGKFVGIQDYLK